MTVGVKMDQDTLARIVRLHQAELYRYMRYLGAPADAAEDLVQETFIAAYRNPKTDPNQPDRALAAWLRGIGRNQFLKYCRKRKQQPQCLSHDKLQQAELYWTGTYLRDGDGFDYFEALRKCLAALSEKKRQAISLRYSQNKSREQMADVLGLTEHGVRNMLQRIRQGLADCVKRRLQWEQV